MTTSFWRPQPGLVEYLQQLRAVGLRRGRGPRPTGQGPVLAALEASQRPGPQHLGAGHPPGLALRALKPPPHPLPVRVTHPALPPSGILRSCYHGPRGRVCLATTAPCSPTAFTLTPWRPLRPSARRNVTTSSHPDLEPACRPTLPNKPPPRSSPGLSRSAAIP